MNSVGTGSKKGLSHELLVKNVFRFILIFFFFKFCNSADLNLQPWHNVPTNCASIQSPFQLLIQKIWTTDTTIIMLA